MPDYDLGRAHGEVIITADTSGAERAAASMAGVDAEAKALNRTLGDTNKGLGQHEQAMRRTADVTQGYQRRVDELQKAEEKYRKTLLDSKATAQDIQRARRDQVSAARNLEEAERALHEVQQKSANSLKTLMTAVLGFGRNTDDSRKHVQGLTTDLHKASEAADKLANTLSSTLGTALKVLGGAGGVGIAGGALGLLGGGAASGGVNALAGIVETVKDFSGAIALMPALVSAAGVSIGTLAVSLHGVGDALKNMDDPTKFAAALAKMSPAAQEAMRTIASFSNAFKSAGKEVQQSFFQPLLDSIKPLITTWLPQLMHAGQQVGGAFGQLGHTVMQAFMQPQVIQGFNTFIGNLTKALQGLQPAIAPIVSAFTTLNVVGSQSFGRLSETVVKLANSFNQFIQNAAQTGQLTAWINRALDAFSSLWAIMRNVAQAFNNIMAIGDKFGGNFLSILERITAEFDAWTKSAQGQQTLTAFFTAIHAAGQALSPVLKTIGADFAILLTALAKLGTSMAPGIEVFFQGLGQALQILGNALTASGPAFTVVLAELGNLLVQLVQQVGPQLPGIFMQLAEALVNVAPAFVLVAGALANFMSHMTAGDIELILGLVGAIKIAIPIIGALNAVMDANPISILILAIAGLVAGVIYAYTHFKTFHDTVNNAFNAVKEFAQGVGPALGELWNVVSTTFTNLIGAAENWGKNLLGNFINGIKSKFNDLTGTLGDVGQAIVDFWQHKSPHKQGPLHDAGGTQQMGANATTQFATGIESASSKIDDATSRVAAQAAKGYGGISGVASNIGASFLSPGTGAGGGAFTSSGRATTSGGATLGVGGGGKSGFDAYIANLTSDLSAFGKIAKDSFDLFQSVAQIAMQTTKVIASVWGNGVNPMTMPGGIFNTPGQGPAAPMPELTPQHYAPGGVTPAVPQQDVPGVPPLQGPGAPANPPAQVQGQAPAGTQGPAPPTTGLPTGITKNAQGQFQQNASPQQIQASIIAGGRARGLTDQQISGALAVAGAESNYGQNIYGGDQGIGGAWGVYQQGNAYGAVGDRQDPNKAIDQFLNLYATQLKAQPNLTPLQVAAGVQQHGGPGSPGSWQGTAGDQGYLSAITAHNGEVPIPAQVQGQAPAGTQGGPPPKPGAFAPAPKGQIPQEMLDVLQDPYGLNAAAAPAFTPQPYGLPAGVDTGGYGSPKAAKTFPQWVLDLGAQFNVKPSTYPGHQEGPHNLANGQPEKGYAPNPQNQNRGIDWVGSRADMERFAQALLTYGGAEGSGGALEQVIYQAGPGGTKYGLGGAGNVAPGYYPQSGKGSYDEHGGLDTGAHVHTRFSASVPPTLDGASNQPIPVDVTQTGGVALKDNAIPMAAQGGANQPGIVAGPNMPLGQPLTQEQRRAAGIPDSMPPIYPSAKPGPLPAAAAVPGSAAPTLQPGQPNLTTPDPFYAQNSGQGNQQTALTAQTTSSASQFSSALSSAGSIAGDAFQVFDDVVKSIGAAANITDQLVRGFANTEDVVKFITQMQQFITTAADIAKLVSDTAGTIGQFVGAGSSADPSGATAGVAAAFGIVSAVSSIVGQVLTAINASITLGIEVYHEVTKFQAMIEGFTLGNAQTGQLTGNVQMLLNTQTGAVTAWGDQNPLLKANHQLPSWFANAYGGNRPATSVINNNQLVQYVGPGQSPMQMMSDTMWLVGTGAPSVASVAGRD